VHPNQISHWKRQLLDEGSELFSRNGASERHSDAVQSDLFEQIGRLKMELEWLKKKAAPFS
jgi:putative transposase